MSVLVAFAAAVVGLAGAILMHFGDYPLIGGYLLVMSCCGMLLVATALSVYSRIYRNARAAWAVLLLLIAIVAYAILAYQAFGKAPCGELDRAQCVEVFPPNPTVSEDATPNP